MAKTIKKQLIEKAFAKAYVESGYNATGAMKTINPSLQTNSASTAGYELVKSPEVQEHIAIYKASVKEQAQNLLSNAIIATEKLLQEPNPLAQKEAIKLAIEINKLFVAPTEKVNDNRKLILNYPKK